MKKIVLSLLALGAVWLSAAAQQPARYIFYFIGDGMGPGAVITAQNYLGDQPLLMTTFPVTSMITTYSASSPVTDSAAAGTALSTGYKTKNGMLGMSPDTVAVRSVAADLQELGFGIGVATSVAPDDATPAAFYAHVPNRGMYYEIGAQAARSGIDFLAGADMRGWRDKDGNETDLRKLFWRNNVGVARGLDQLATLTTPKVVLLNIDTIRPWTIGYANDRNPEGALTLPGITRAAIDHLTKVRPENFFLMVEGGAIDHAAHANDAGTVVADMLAFDEALKHAYDFYLQHPDETLIVVTADHETGGMSLGNTATGYMANTKILDNQKISKDIMTEEIKSMLKSRRNYTWDEISGYLAENLGLGTAIHMTDEQIARLKEAYNSAFVERDGNLETTLYAKHGPVTVEAFKILNEHTGAGWTSIHHTGNPVMIFAIGPGSELFSPMSDNTDVPRRILEAAKRKSPPVVRR